MEAATDGKVWKDIEERMGVLQTTLKKAKALVAENEDHLEESQIREEEARHGDQGQSNSSEEHEDDDMVEEPEESGLTGTESTSPPKNQETEPSMEVDEDSAPPLTSGGGITVSAKEEQILMDDSTSVAGEMARLQVSSPDSHKPEDGETL